MGKAKTRIGFSEKFIVESNAIDKALSKVTKHLIAETKATNSYIVVSDKNGKVKKIPAKDL
jgi:hypothetical protein